MNRFDDLLNRFEGLLNRFEGGEGVAPTPSGSGQPSTPAKRLHKAVKELNQAINEPLKKFVELSEKHPNKLINEATLLSKEGFELALSIVHAITLSKKETTENMAKVVSPHLKDLDKKIGDKSKKLEIKNHCRALLDGLQLIQLTIMEDPHDMGKEFLGQIDFYGNKVIQLQTEPDTEW